MLCLPAELIHIVCDEVERTASPALYGRFLARLSRTSKRFLPITRLRLYRDPTVFGLTVVRQIKLFHTVLGNRHLQPLVKTLSTGIPVGTSVGYTKEERLADPDGQRGVQTWVASEMYIAWLHCLVAHCPRLTTVAAPLGSISDLLVEVLASRRLPHLIVQVQPGRPQIGLSVLDQIPYIPELTLEGIGHLNELRLERIVLPQVDNLHLSFGDAAFLGLAAFARQADDQYLRHIKISTLRHPTTAQVEEAGKLIGGRVESLAICIDKVIPATRWNYDVYVTGRSYTLSSTLVQFFPEARSLVFQHSFDLTLDNIVSLLVSSPRLRTLSLRHSTWRRSNWTGSHALEAQEALSAALDSAVELQILDLGVLPLDPRVSKLPLLSARCRLRGIRLQWLGIELHPSDEVLVLSDSESESEDDVQVVPPAAPPSPIVLSDSDDIDSEVDVEDDGPVILPPPPVLPAGPPVLPPPNPPAPPAAFPPAVTHHSCDSSSSDDSKHSGSYTPTAEKEGRGKTMRPGRDGWKRRSQESDGAGSSGTAASSSRTARDGGVGCSASSAAASSSQQASASYGGVSRSNSRAGSRAAASRKGSMSAAQMDAALASMSLFGSAVGGGMGRSASRASRRARSKAGGY